MTSCQNPIGITVLVFGYHSDSRLNSVLHSIARQKISSEINWEVILMDNASPEQGTGEKGIKIWRETGSKIPFRTIREKKEGLVYSRITGIANSLYEYIVFVDDDNLLDEKYLQCAYELMNGMPEIGALGGKILALYESPPPEWLKKNESCLAVGEQGKGTEDISEKKGFVWGAGMVLRRTALRKLQNAGFNFFIMKKKGKLIGYGDDYELCLFLRLAGYKIFYSQKLILKHIINKDRLEWKYIKNLYKKFGVSSVPLDGVLYYLKKNKMNVIPELLCLWNILSAGKNIFLSTVKRFYNEEQTSLILNIKYFEGRLFSLIRSFFSEYRKYFIRAGQIKEKCRSI